MFFLLAPLLSGHAARAGEEMVQCSDSKKGEPAIFRKGECQPLDDPTAPPGGQTGQGGGGVPSQPELETIKKTLQETDAKKQAELDALKKEVESVRQKLTDIQDVGRYEIRPGTDEEVQNLGAPGPWRVSLTLVPAPGEKNTEKQAVINGYRYRLGERVDGGVIKEIARDRVVMEHEGKETVVPFNKTTHASVFGRVGSVKLTRFHGTYLVKLRINNNQEIDAVVDTGASNLVLPEDVVTWLTRSGTLKPEDFIGEGKSVLADGSMHDTRLLRIHSLRLGEMELKEVEASELPGGQKGGKEKGKADAKTGGKEPEKGRQSPDDKKPESAREFAETQPLFGLNGLKMLGKWRIDHVNDLLVVER